MKRYWRRRIKISLPDVLDWKSVHLWKNGSHPGSKTGTCQGYDYMDCDNYASEKVILANGGILEKEIIVEGEVLRKYWIQL